MVNDLAVERHFIERVRRVLGAATGKRLSQSRHALSEPAASGHHAHVTKSRGDPLWRVAVRSGN
jgi:hypothetical protein